MAYERLIYTNADGESIEFSPYSTFWTNFKKDVTGYSDVAATLTTIDTIGSNGSSWVSSKINEKTITIKGAINMTSKPSIVLARRKLNHILNPVLSGTLTYAYNGIRRTMECHPVTAPSYSSDSIYYRYSIDLQCTDPFWHDEDKTRKSIVGFAPNWYWTEDSTYIVEDSFFFGHRYADGYIDVENPGDTDVGAIFTITTSQSCYGVLIQNVGTGKWIRYNGTILPGQTVEIDTRKGHKTVTLTKIDGTTEDHFHEIDPDSEFIQLTVGSNRFKMYAKDGDARYISVYATFYPGYLGV